jgi:hypothetical protein
VVAQLSAALERQEESRVPRLLTDAVRQSRKNQTLSTLSLSAELFRILDLFQSASLDTAVVKGPGLSQRAYGNPASRDYGDIDILLRHSDVARASQLLIATGLEPRISDRELRSGKTPGQYFFRRHESGAAIELHTERTLRYFPRPLPIEAFFQRKTNVDIDGHAIPVLSLEDEFVFISIHGAKHFWERLMWIADIAAVVHRHPQLDWSRVRQTAAEVGAERMVRVAVLLAERLLRISMPVEMKRRVVADKSCASIVRKIESWLPYAGYEPPLLAQRALFRLRMRGHLLAGTRYLTRLSFSTTEEDWSPDAAAPSPASSLHEALRRPFRLAKKYRRNPGR